MVVRKTSVYLPWLLMFCRHRTCRSIHLGAGSPVLKFAERRYQARASSPAPAFDCASRRLSDKTNAEEINNPFECLSHVIVSI